MGASLDYCLANIGRSSYTDRDWSKAVEQDAKPRFTDVIMRLIGEQNDIPTIEGFDASKYTYGAYVGRYEPERSVTFEFAPDMRDFQYFTSDTCKTDGAILPIIGCFDSIIMNVIEGNTYFSKLHPPRKGDKIHYKVGNFVVLTEYGEFGTEEKPWLQERITVLLPLAMSYEDDENEDTANSL